jgi:CBS domain-containing protein
MRLFAGDEDGNREDDYGAIAPSVYALQAALVLVAGAIKIMREDIPGVPVVDSEGGIRITWKQGDRLVRLVCPAAKEGQLYIYQSSAGVNSILNQNVTAEALATRLATLVAREPVAD